MTGQRKIYLYLQQSGISSDIKTTTISIFRYSGYFRLYQTCIPANKIRSCTKSSGVLQRICGTMNISITTTGDSAEIYFWCIDNGDEAYELISQIAKENGNS